MMNGSPAVRAAFAEGKIVFGFPNQLTKDQTGGWVRQVASKSGQPVEWCVISGKACIVTLGDVSAVHAAIKELRPELDEMLAAFRASRGPRYAPDLLDAVEPSQFEKGAAA